MIVGAIIWNPESLWKWKEWWTKKDTWIFWKKTFSSKTGSGSSLHLPTWQQSKTYVCVGVQLPSEDQSEWKWVVCTKPWLTSHLKYVEWQKEECPYQKEIKLGGTWEIWKRRMVLLEACWKLQQLQAVLQQKGNNRLFGLRVSTILLLVVCTVFSFVCKLK